MNRLILTSLLCGFAVIGNFFNLPLFFSVTFIFGSISALIAVRLLGLVPGVIVALVGGAYTWYLWGHPYAMVIFTIEAFSVWWLYRYIRNLALADALYWVALGGPLVMLFYGGILGMENNAAGLIALKQGTNGIFNAVGASLLILALGNVGVLRKVVGHSEISFSVVLFNLFVLLASLAAVTPIVLDSRRLVMDEERFVEERLRIVGKRLQAEITQLEKSGTEKAVFSDRLQSALARLGDFAPQREVLGIALLTASDDVLASWGKVRSFGGDGKLFPGQSGLMVWKPDGEMPVMLRWRRSQYVLRIPLDLNGTAAMAVIEQAAEPVVNHFDTHSAREMTALAAIMLTAIVIAQFLSQWINRPIRSLGQLSKELSTAITNGATSVPTFPRSAISEYSALSSSMKDMARQLADSFSSLREMNETLEQRVRERTLELERLSMVASQTTNGVIITDTNGRTEWVNEGFCRITGYTIESLRGKKPGEVLQGPETDPATVASIREALSRQATFQVEIINYHKSGTPYWVNIHCNPMRDGTGKVTGFIAIETDISHRKITDQALERALERLALAVDAGSIGVWEFDPRTGALVWDDQMFSLYGIDRQAFAATYDAWKSALHPEDFIIAIERVEEAFKPGGRPFDIEFRTDHPEKGERILRGISRVVRDGDGTPLRMTGVNFDVTADREASKALAEAALHIQAVLDNVVDGIVTVESTGLVQSFNKSAETIFGYRQDEVIGREVNTLMADGDFDLVSGNTRSEREVEGRRKSGDAFPMELAVSEVMRKGQTTFIAIIRDITERKRIDRMKSEFISTVSHELRTPLTSIAGALGLIAGGALGKLPDKAASLVATAMRNSERLTHLINDLLDMEKIAAGNMILDRQVLSVASLVEQAIEVNQGYATKHGVYMTLRRPVPPGAISVDAGKFMQILANFLSNAVKFSQEGGAVELSVEDAGPNLRISVSDQGAGIPEEFHSRIFQKFFQVDSSDTRQKGGTGLGLAITKELAERMDGHVGFVSAAGKRTTFWVEFPRVGRGNSHPDGGAPFTQIVAP